MIFRYLCLKSKSDKLMIKKIVLASVAIFVLISCENSQNYSVQLENQRKQIREYIERNGISLIETYPTDSVFKSNEYLWMGQDSIILDRRAHV